MQLVSTHTVMTSDIGVNDNLFGGQMLSWLDEDACAFAVQYIHNPYILTLKFSDCIFHRPAKLNNLIMVYCEVTHVGRTSITVSVEARRKDVVHCQEELICSTSVIMVQIDKEGKPFPINQQYCVNK